MSCEALLVAWDGAWNGLDCLELLTTYQYYTM